MNAGTNAHPDSEDVLRMLAVGHLGPDSPAWVAAAAGVAPSDPSLQTAAWLGALVATNANSASFAAIVDHAVGAGVTIDELVGLLLCLAPVIGSAHVVSAAPALAAALGIDIDSLLEDDGGPKQIST